MSRIAISPEVILVTLENGKIGLFHTHGFVELESEDARTLTKELVTHFAKLRRQEILREQRKKDPPKTS